jgi:membrane fusion protein, heavy metal efflux system
MILTNLRMFLLSALLIGPALASTDRALAHDGHDHGAPPTPVSTTIAPRVDASSTLFELIGVSREGRLTLYLDRFITNEPVKDADIEVETPKGAVKATPNPDGTYALDAAFAAKGEKHDLIFTVTAAGDVDVLTGVLTIPADVGGAPTAVRTSSWVGSAIAQGLRDRVAASDLSLPAVALVAFIMGLLFARIGRRNATAVLTVGLALSAFNMTPDAQAAETAGSTTGVAPVDLAQRFPDGALFVPKATQRILAIRTIMVASEEHRRAVSLPGRVIPDPAASGNVQASVTGRLSPPQGGFPRLGTRVKTGDVLALVSPAIGSADITTQQQQARELDQQLTLVQRRLERLRPIANIVARSQIEDAELELAGLQKRRANLELAQKREPEKLLAPVDGVIAAATASPGQVVETNAVIFQIIDPGKLWIEALTFDAMAGTRNAAARLGDGRALKLEYQGTGFAERNQAIPIHFAVSEDTGGLRMGQLLTVITETEETRTGIAVPRASVVRASNGQALVYEHANAERFVPREVRVEPLDGERVIIVSGIAAGKRIVTQGVELLNQIR